MAQLWSKNIAVRQFWKQNLKEDRAWMSPKNSTLVLGKRMELLQCIWNTSTLRREKKPGMKCAHFSDLPHKSRLNSSWEESPLGKCYSVSIMDHNQSYLMEPTLAESQQGPRFHVLLQHSLHVFCQVLNMLAAQPCYLLPILTHYSHKAPHSWAEGYLLWKVQNTSTDKSQLQSEKALRLSTCYLHIRISLNQR